MAECRIHSAWVSIPGSTELQSFYASGRTPVANPAHVITTNEVVRALELAKASHVTSDYYLASAVPLGFELGDSSEWVQKPNQYDRSQHDWSLSAYDDADCHYAKP